jgi:hypothetical protein
MNTSDISYAIIVEDVAGVTPTTGAWIPVAVLDSSTISLESDMVEAETKTATRDGLGARALTESVTGQFEMELRASPAIKVLFESAYSGTLATNVIKAGKADKSFTVRKLTQNADGVNVQYYRGVQCVSANISGEVGTFIRVTFPLVGQSLEETDTEIEGLTEGVESSVPLLTSAELGLVKIGAFDDLELSSFTLEVAHTRNAVYKMGAKQARNIATSGRRNVTGSVTVFKEDHTLANTLGEVGQLVEITLGRVGNGIKLTVYKANFSRPQDEEDEMIYSVINLSGGLDPVANTSTSVTFL